MKPSHLQRAVWLEASCIPSSVSMCGAGTRTQNGPPRQTQGEGGSLGTSSLMPPWTSWKTKGKEAACPDHTTPPRRHGTQPRGPQNPYPVLFPSPHAVSQPLRQETAPGMWPETARASGWFQSNARLPRPYQVLPTSTFVGNRRARGPSLAIRQSETGLGTSG